MPLQAIVRESEPASIAGEHSQWKNKTHKRIAAKHVVNLYPRSEKELEFARSTQAAVSARSPEGHDSRHLAPSVPEAS